MTSFPLRAWLKAPLLFMVTAGSALQLTACTTPDLNSKFSLPAEEIMVGIPDLKEREENQIMIARLTTLLNETNTTHEQRAMLFYQLGILYDRLGLEVTARTMFMNALIEVPDFAEAYNFLGIYLSTTEHFAEAYDAWDAVLEINPKESYALFNRGIALYYGQRPALALTDLEAFYKVDSNDPFRIAWLYIVEREVYGQDIALTHLNEHRQQITAEVPWGLELLAFLAGEMSSAQVIDSIRHGEGSQGQKNHQLCEAYFYIAKMAALEGREKQAYDYFHMCVVTGVAGYLEYRYAILEIQMLERAEALRKYGVQEHTIQEI